MSAFEDKESKFPTYRISLFLQMTGMVRSTDLLESSCRSDGSRDFAFGRSGSHGM